MKRKFLFTLLLALCLLFTGNTFNSIYAQRFDVESKVVNLGIGIGGTYGYGIAFTGSFEKGFKNIEDFGVLSLGGIVGFQTGSQVFSYYRYNGFMAAARVAAHPSFLEVDPNLDLYGGVAIGVLADNRGYWSRNNAIRVVPFGALFFGGRYYFDPRLAGFAEFGWDIVWLKVGISVNL